MYSWIPSDPEEDKWRENKRLEERTPRRQDEESVIENSAPLLESNRHNISYNACSDVPATITQNEDESGRRLIKRNATSASSNPLTTRRRHSF